MFGTINVRIPSTTIGAGAINALPDAIKRLASNKVLIVTDAVLVKAGILDTVKAPLEKAGLKFDIYDGCREEPPMHIITELSQKVKKDNYDLLIGVGGGSVMDTVKVTSVIALNNMTVQDYVSTLFYTHKIKGKIIPKILIPTTAGTGSEWGSVAVVYGDEPNKRNYVVHALENFAEEVIIDPMLMLSIPQRLAANTGVDVLTHAIEAYTCQAANFFSDLVASNAINLVADNVRRVYAKGRQSPDAYHKMAIASAFSQAALESSGPGMIHGGLCGILSQETGVAHGITLGILLPAVMTFNLIACPAKFAKIAELMGENISGMTVLDAAAKSVDAVQRLVRDLDMPQRMRDIGVTEKDIPKMAKLAYECSPEIMTILNARVASVDDIARIYKAAL